MSAREPTSAAEGDEYVEVSGETSARLREIAKTLDCNVPAALEEVLREFATAFLYRYPRSTGSALIECPEHACVVVLGTDGRICTCCPHCKAEARHVLRLWSGRRYRARLAKR